MWAKWRNMGWTTTAKWWVCSCYQNCWPMSFVCGRTLYFVLMPTNIINSDLDRSTENADRSLTLPHTLCCWVLKANRELFQTKIEWTERAQSRRIWAKARVATGLGKTSCFMWLKYWWLRGKRWSSRAKLKPNQESLCVIIRHLDWLLQAKASNRELFIRKMRDIYFTKVNDSPH